MQPFYVALERCPLDNLSIKRNMEVSEIIAIIRVVFIFLILCSIYSLIPEEINQNKIVCTIVMMTIILIITIILLKTWKYFIKTSYQTLIITKKDIAFLIGETLLLTVIIFLTGAQDSKYKNLYFLAIIINSIRFGSKMGILSSTLSAFGIVFNDMILQLNLSINNYLEADLVIIVTFFVTGWMLGTFMENEIKYRQKLSHQANTDVVTDLYNHRYFQERLDREIKNAKNDNDNPNLGLIMIDLDYFKYYNDTFGHQKGDILLKKIGETIKENIKDSDVVCRYGGDEFSVILLNTDSKEAADIAEKIRESIDSKKFFQSKNDPNKYITASIGVAIYPDNALDKDSLIKKADDAMYKAKYLSKNRVEVYSSVLDDLKSSLVETDQSLLDSIRTLITVINAKDKYTYGHSERVVSYATTIGNALKLSQDEIKQLRYSAYLHDIGKIEISRDILNKITPLTDNEWNILKKHPVWGTEIVKPIEALHSSIPSILYHHERFDGKGYPEGLKGYEIPLFARILAVADSFDAMTTNRPYKKGMSIEDAIEELLKCKGSQFDPDIVDKFVYTFRNSESSM